VAEALIITGDVAQGKVMKSEDHPSRAIIFCQLSISSSSRVQCGALLCGQRGLTDRRFMHARAVLAFGRGRIDQGRRNAGIVPSAGLPAPCCSDDSASAGDPGFSAKGEASRCGHLQDRGFFSSELDDPCSLRFLRTSKLNSNQRAA
jgi:hypothetical protein